MNRLHFLCALVVLLWGSGCGEVSSLTRDRRSDGWAIPNDLGDEHGYSEIVRRINTNLGKTVVLKTNCLGSEIVCFVRYPSNKDRCSEVLCFEEVDKDYWAMRGIVILRMYDEPEVALRVTDGAVEVLQDRSVVFSIAPTKKMYAWQSISRYVRGGDYFWSTTNRLTNAPPMFKR